MRFYKAPVILKDLILSSLARRNDLVIMNVHYCHLLDNSWNTGAQLWKFQCYWLKESFQEDEPGWSLCSSGEAGSSCLWCTCYWKAVHDLATYAHCSVTDRSTLIFQTLTILGSRVLLGILTILFRLASFTKYCILLVNTSILVSV